MAQPSQPSQPSRKRRKGKQECSRDLACLHDDVLLVALAFLTGAEVGRFARVSSVLHCFFSLCSRMYGLIVCACSCRGACTNW